MIRDHPAEFAAAFRIVIMAALTVAVSFGAPITSDQRAAVETLGAALISVAALVSGYTIANTVPKVLSATAPLTAVQLVPPTVQLISVPAGANLGRVGPVPPAPPPAAVP